MAPAPIYPYAFFEGEIVPFSDAKVSVGTHALQYGTGAFAGIRGYLDAAGETINVFRLRDHTTRFLRSARLLRAELPFTPETLAEKIVELIERNEPDGDIYIRPFCYKASVVLTPRLLGLQDEVAIYMMPLTDYIESSSGLKACVSSWVRIADNAIPSRGKLSGGYVNSALAKDEAEEKGADEAILLNAAGKVGEGSACNLFIVRDGTLITPPFSADILEGITRRSLIEFAEVEGLALDQRDIDRSELYIADEAFFCGTGMQIAPIVTIDGRPVGDGKPGPLTNQLKELFFGVVRGRDARYQHYLTPIKMRATASH